MNYYQKRKEKGLCIHCGKVAADEGYKSCANCRKERMDEYYFFKSAGFCSRCRKERIFPGESLCPECRAVAAEKQGSRRNKDPKRMVEIQKKHRYKMREEGRCIRCGKPSNGKYRCQRCADKGNRKRREWEEQNKTPGVRDIWRAEGKCVFCGGEREKGKLQCTECIEKRRPKNQRNHIWSKENKLIFSGE